MARYTKSRTKLSRRIGRNLFLKGERSFSSKDDYSRKPFLGGKKKFKRTSSQSNFSKQLLEKQAIKYTYGILEKQLANVFKKSFKKKGDTASLALEALERRLDNVLYRGGLANSRSQARQLVNHGHFLVNGIKTNIPSFQVKKGDKIRVKNNKTKSNFWKEFKLQVPFESTNWINKVSDFELQIVSIPLADDLPKEFNMPSVVEFYSNKVA